ATDDLHHHQWRVIFSPEQSPYQVGHGEDDRHGDKENLGCAHGAKVITLSGRRQWPGVDFGENSQILRRASNRAETGGSFGEQGGKPANPAGLLMVPLSCVEASVGNGSRRFWRRERNFRSNAGLAHKLTLWQKQSCEHRASRR